MDQLALTLRFNKAVKQKLETFAAKKSILSMDDLVFKAIDFYHSRYVCKEEPTTKSAFTLLQPSQPEHVALPGIIEDASRPGDYMANIVLDGESLKKMQEIEALHPDKETMHVLMMLVQAFKDHESAETPPASAAVQSSGLILPARF